MKFLCLTDQRRESDLPVIPKRIINFMKDSEWSKQFMKKREEKKQRKKKA